MIRVLVADDQALVRGEFRLMIDAQPDTEGVGEAADGAAAVATACELLPDVVLMDILMPGIDGLEATRRLVAAAPSVRVRVRVLVLVLTTFDLDEYVYEATRAGASGFLVKDVAPADLAHGVRTVAAGEALLAPSVVRRLMDDFARRPPPGSHPPGSARCADRARAGSAHPDRPRPDQRRDRYRAVHQRDDGAHPRDARAAEARPPRPDPDGRAGVGASTAQDGAADLVARLDLQPGIQVRVEDVFTVSGFRMTLDRVHTLAHAVAAQLRDPDVAGVVVTHGTDTTEETAFFLDLFHDDARPVVLTGAQRAADAPDSDGPRNLGDAVTVAASPAARGLGVLIGFGGQLFPARGTRKTHTLAADTFTNPSGGALGWVHGGQVGVATTPRRRPALDLDAFDPGGLRVDVVACYPDADATALHAFAHAGARGFVLEATGAGNANPEICAAVRQLTAAGIVVVTSTRVASGPVTAIYGDGGGVDLQAAGAVPSGLLRPSQARMLLAALLGTHRDPDVVRAAFARSATG